VIKARLCAAPGGTLFADMSVSQLTAALQICGMQTVTLLARHVPQRLTQVLGPQPHTRSRSNPSDIAAGMPRHPPAQINTSPPSFTMLNSVLFQKKLFPFFSRGGFRACTRSQSSLASWQTRLCVLWMPPLLMEAPILTILRIRLQFAAIACQKSRKHASWRRSIAIASFQRSVTLPRMMAIFISMTNISRQPPSTRTNHHHLCTDSIGPRSRDCLR
jgi:hypothetical protein